MEHNKMTKTILLSGDALRIARQIVALKEGHDQVMADFQKRAQEIADKNRRDIDAFYDEMRRALELKDGAHVHLDVDYLSEHGLAFITTGCEDEGGNGASDLLSRLLGGGAPKPSHGGGTH